MNESIPAGEEKRDGFTCVRRFFDRCQVQRKWRVPRSKQKTERMAAAIPGSLSVKMTAGAKRNAWRKQVNTQVKDASDSAATSDAARITVLPLGPTVQKQPSLSLCVLVPCLVSKTTTFLFPLQKARESEGRGRARE
jgi:hypothetical protein